MYVNAYRQTSKRYTLTFANCATYLDQSPRSVMDMIRTSDETPTEIDRTLSEIASATLDTICTMTWDRVCLATNSNDTMLRLVEIIEDGIPESREDFPQALCEFYQFRDDLYTVDGVVMYGGRVVIPPSLREECLIALHAAHGGCTSMLSRAECSIFCHGITPAIQKGLKSQTDDSVDTIVYTSCTSITVPTH